MKQNNYFPNIFRNITERKLFKKYLNHKASKKYKEKLQKPYAYTSLLILLISVFLLMLLIGFTANNLYLNYNNYKITLAQRNIIYGKINFWKSILEKYSGYPDAYLNVATLYFQLGEFKLARENVNKALILNPGMDKANDLSILLRKRGY